MVRSGLRQDRAWFERMMRIVKNINPNILMLDYYGLDDVENAIFRQLDNTKTVHETSL